ncbi:MAG: hypothetical protein ACYC9D_12965 [Candidatus Dormibacteria bacterium]
MSELKDLLQIHDFSILVLHYIKTYKLNHNTKSFLWIDIGSSYHCDRTEEFHAWLKSTFIIGKQLEHNDLFDVFYVYIQTRNWDTPVTYLNFVFHNPIHISELGLVNHNFLCNTDLVSYYAKGSRFESFQNKYKDILSSLNSIVYPQTGPDIYTPMKKRTLLQLRTSYKRDATISTRSTAYFWQWISSIIYDIIYGKVVNYDENDSYQTRIEKTINRLNKIFNEDFVFVGYSYPYISTKSLIFPRKLCSTYWTANNGREFILSIDFNKLRDQGIIRWDSLNKLWASEESFRIVRKVNPTNPEKPLQMEVAFVGDEKLKYQNCSCCDILWSRIHLVSLEGQEKTCPLCVLEQQKPNIPHKIDTIYQQYHHSVRNGWKYKIKRLKNEDQMPMGVELEVESRPIVIPNPQYETQTHRAWDIYQGQIKANPDWHELMFERDGSLGSHGIEIISNPMTLDFAVPFWTTMIPIIQKNAVGWNTESLAGPQPEYGIHLTCSREYWSDFRMARMIKFLSNPENTFFMLAIAQRATLYGGTDIGKFDPALKKHVTFISKGKLGTSPTRYTLANVKQKFIELRMFRSTLNLESFLKNLEFFDALHHWCKETPYSIHYMDYIKWILHTPETRERYKNLISYLNRSKFYIKKLKSPIVNTWKDVISQYAKGQRALFELTDTIVDTIPPDEEP